MPCIMSTEGPVCRRSWSRTSAIPSERTSARNSLPMSHRYGCFLGRYGELMNFSASAQRAMRKVFDAHLKRVEWGKLRFPVRLYPFIVSERADAKSIVMCPQISFGRPVVNNAFISTRSIVDRIDAGETVEDVARDYDLTREV